jgi:hypothetical protein
MWRHRPWMIAWASLAAAVPFVALSLLGFGSMSSRVGVVLAVALLTTVAATDYRVVAQTVGPRNYLFRASRIRQVAVELLGDLSPNAEMEVVSTNLVLTDWLVDGERYTVPKSSQAAMSRLAARD